MILTVDVGWAIAPIRGNPYPTVKACTIVLNVIKKRNIHWIDRMYFSEVRCVPRKVED
jgi:hypothetical protein